ncbi:hypothetical protein K402DRAFT_461755 [Aulographum hederae CBS 113979]|uniref:Uncharacterized protein n=1 Tax=Aulographum hederae CBS 113979 TaxID=1176131 RepID=A0A6G1H706_9PEZI|nr:hypothetical protein K402DRAFT_461755 [Aulographum hederae CBS 113979]
MRIQVNQQQNVSLRLRKDLEDGTRQLIELITSPVGMTTEQSQEIQRRQEDVAQQEQELRDYDSSLGKSYRALYNEESTLGEKEEAFYDCLQLAFPSRKILSPSPRREPSIASSDHLPPLVAEFYDRSGDLDIWRNRLHDFELDHRKAQQDRLFQTSPRKVFEPSERDFYSQYYETKASLVNEILDIQKDITRIRKSCQEAGIEIEESPQQMNGSEEEPLTYLDDLYPLSSLSAHLRNPIGEVGTWLSGLESPGVEGEPAVRPNVARAASADAIREIKSKDNE